MAHREELGNGVNYNGNLVQQPTQPQPQQPMVNYQNTPMPSYQPGQPLYIDRTLDEQIDIFKKMLLTGTMVNQAVANVGQVQNQRLCQSYDYVDENEVVDAQYRNGATTGKIIIGIFVVIGALRHFLIGG